MKLKLALLMILPLSLSLAACSGSPGAPETTGESVGSNPALSQIVLEVPTIWCSSCQPRVYASATGVPGVKDVRFDGTTVTITYDPQRVDPKAIVEAIERGGDRVEGMIAQ